MNNIETFTSSINTTIKTQLNANTVISSSAQLTTEFDSRYLNTNGDGVISGSSQVQYNSISGVPTGLISGSSQVSYTGLSNIPSGIVSGSSQIQLNGITGTTFASSAFIFPSDLTVSGSLIMQRGREKTTVSATAATGSINYDVLTQSVVYYTTNSTGNWTLNIRGDASTTLNNSMNTGETLTIVFMATNGATAYRQTGFQIDGSNVTPKWLGGTAPSAGSANSIDVYTISIVKTGSATFTVFESFAKYT